jgi:hypothetical protein
MCDWVEEIFERVTESMPGIHEIGPRNTLVALRQAKTS